MSAPTFPAVRDVDIEEAEFAAVNAEFRADYGPEAGWLPWQIEQYLTALNTIRIRHALGQVAL